MKEHHFLLTEIFKKSVNYVLFSGCALVISLATSVAVYAVKGAEVLALFSAVKMLSISGGWPKLLDFGLVPAAVRLYLEKDQDIRVFRTLLTILSITFFIFIAAFYWLSIGDWLFGEAYATIKNVAFLMLLLLLAAPFVLVSHSVLQANKEISLIKLFELTGGIVTSFFTLLLLFYYNNLEYALYSVGIGQLVGQAWLIIYVMRKYPGPIFSPARSLVKPLLKRSIPFNALNTKTILITNLPRSFLLAQSELALLGAYDLVSRIVSAIKSVINSASAVLVPYLYQHSDKISENLTWKAWWINYATVYISSILASIAIIVGATLIPQFRGIADLIAPAFFMTSSLPLFTYWCQKMSVINEESTRLTVTYVISGILFVAGLSVFYHAFSLPGIFWLIGLIYILIGWVMLWSLYGFRRLINLAAKVHFSQALVVIVLSAL